MKNSDITDSLFRKAVEAIDSGNISLLQRLLETNPQLITKRLDTPTEEGYFKNPYLLWFVADNPIRHEKLPENIMSVTQTILKALQSNPTDTYQYQLTYTLGLVATGRIPKECGVQIELIDLLIDAGAAVGRVHGALAHNNIDAAAHLISKGAELTIAAAVGLERMSDVMRLAKNATVSDMQVALIVASFFGNAEVIAFLINAGVDVNAHPDNLDGFHSHASALHQAVYSGSLTSVKLLLEAGARLDATDRVYHGTPLGWAIYMQTGEGHDEKEKKRFEEIEAFLRKQCESDVVNKDNG